MSVSSAKYGKLAEKAGIELKNLDVNKGLSRETWAFTATVYLNGKRVAIAENRGRGGQTMLRPYTNRNGNNRTDGRDKLREAVADLPNVDSQIDDSGISLDAEATVHSLVGHTLHKRKIKRHISNGKVVFRTADQAEGAFSYVEHRGNPEAALEAMKEQHNVVEVYNDGLTA